MQQPAPSTIDHPPPPVPRRPGALRHALAKLRAWIVPTFFVVLVAGLMVPVAYWVLLAAYNRDVDENVAMLQRRVEGQLGGVGPWAAAPKEVWDALVAEVLSDHRVQALCVFDSTRPAPFRVRRSEAITVPQAAKDIDAMLGGDATSMRRKLVWRYDLPRLRAEFSRYFKTQLSESEMRDWLIRNGASPDLVRGYIYLDLSAAALRDHFWAVSKPLLKRVVAFAGIVIFVVSAIATFAWRALRKLGRVRLRAALEQQGLLADRGLTAAVLAHEIRNPMAALRFQLHSLRKNQADTLRVDKTCDTIDGELSRMQQLVQDYLAHEKAQTMRVAAVNLAAEVRSLQTLMDEFLRDSRTELLVSEPEQPVVVSCDPAMLRQVLMNLVLNAQQAMGRGGRITIGLRRDGGFGIIDVIDTGPGIPPEMRERLFKPFQTSRKEGSGIGLALVKRFVDNFGGTVTVDSEIGQGTAFHLRLPLAGQSPSLSAPVAPASVGAGAPTPG